MSGLGAEPARMVAGGSTRQPLGQLSMLAHFTSEPLALANLANTAWRNQAILVKVMGPEKHAV